MSQITRLVPTSGPGSGSVTSVSGGNNITITGDPAVNPTVNVSGTTNHAVQVGNASGSLTSIPVGLTGQVLTGVTGADPVFAAPPSSGVTSITGNTGAAQTGAISLVTANSTPIFAGSAGTITLDFVDANFNTLLGSSGSLAGGQQNVSLGAFSQSGVTTGSTNSSLGTFSLIQLKTGFENLALGQRAGFNLAGAEHRNIYLANDGVLGESNAIRIGTNTFQTTVFIAGIDGVDVGSVATVVTESGDQLGTAVITAGSGITITPGPNTITIDSTVVGGIVTINGDTGSVTGSTVTIQGNGATAAGSSVAFSGSGTVLTLNTTDAGANTIVGLSAGNGAITGLKNSGFGSFSLSSLSSGAQNTCVGYASGFGISTGGNNTCVGYETMASGVTGVQNTSIGSGSLFSLGGGSANTAVGYQTLSSLGTGAFNTALGAIASYGTSSGSYNTSVGYNAGSAYGAASASNITINNVGAAESNTLRIGSATGAGAQQLSAAYICGIDGVNVGSVAKVVTMASDQLGTATITAGTGITVTPSANTITISGSGTTSLTVTPVNNAASPYTVLATDSFLAVNTSGGAVTIRLPNAPATGTVFYVKDSNGTAAASNITVTTVGGAVNIDGATSFVMNTAYESINVVFDGTAYEVF